MQTLYWKKTCFCNSSVSLKPVQGQWGTERVKEEVRFPGHYLALTFTYYLCCKCAFTHFKSCNGVSMVKHRTEQESTPSSWLWRRLASVQLLPSTQHRHHLCALGLKFQSKSVGLSHWLCDHSSDSLSLTGKLCCIVKNQSKAQLKKLFINILKSEENSKAMTKTNKMDKLMNTWKHMKKNKPSSSHLR